MQHDLDSLIRQAKRVLDLNWSASYTKPGPRLYQHQYKDLGEPDSGEQAQPMPTT